MGYPNPESREQVEPAEERHLKLGEEMIALHRATLRILSDLSLEGVLRRIVEAAKDLVGARYAALGVPGEDGKLETFITAGLRPEEEARIAHPPEGKGLLGEMLRTGRSIRVADISTHPKSVGFPPGHPPMRSFLGVPISAYGKPLGQIYLTDKIGAWEFSEADQRLIEMLAAHAAAAIENARLYRQVLKSESELSQRNEELELINDLTSALASTMDLDDLLDEIVQRVMGVFAARRGDVFLADETGVFRLALSHKKGEPFWKSQVFHKGEGLLGKVAAEGRLAWTHELERDCGGMEFHQLEGGVGTLVAVPLVFRQRVVGVLALLFHGEREITPREKGLLEAVGKGVGIAVEIARLNRQSRRLAVLEERERIGMDLHDGIIQSIYAVGLTLESTRALLHSDLNLAKKRLQQGIDALNATIRDIRTYILDLQPSRFDHSGLAQGLERLSRELQANTSITIDLHMEEKALSLLSAEMEQALLRIAQEALANVAKHSQATRAWISARRMGDDLLFQVIDNGVGFDLAQEPKRLGHGLSNMAERAKQIGGACEIDSSPGDGTTITVRLPLERFKSPC
jgi:signal transduction histidine kinase